MFVDALVIGFRPLNFEFVFGMNGVRAFGGVHIGAEGCVTLGAKAAGCMEVSGSSGGEGGQNVANARRESCSKSPQNGVTSGGAVTVECDRPVKGVACQDIVVDEADFTARFDANKKQWTVSWKWFGNDQPSGLKNSVGEYQIKPEARAEYECEVQEWIDRGWLQTYDERTMGPPKGLIPLMAVIQKNKAKVRPVMDFRELNEHIEPFTANADVCADKMREWRKQGRNVALVDLSKAYLQIAVSKDLWPYQTVKFRGQYLCLSRLGFGLNVAPVIMKAILNATLRQDETVAAGTSSYTDDVFVNEDVVSADAVRTHLQCFGLSSKTPERMTEGARVLGLRVKQTDDRLQWSRDNAFGTIPEKLTRRLVFSFCGRLTGHHPVCGWLRVAAAYIKRRANAVTVGWDDPVKDSGEVRHMLEEVVRRVQASDPVGGRWDVSGDEMSVWTDASSLAMGVVLDVGGDVVEDACWLRTEEATHINLAELDAAVKCINLALVWKAKKIRLLTDSRTVYHWISDALSGRARLRTKATSEMLIRRRLALLTALVDEFELSVSVVYVTSACNKADALTRVPREWLKTDSNGIGGTACGVEAMPTDALIKAVHEASGHPGISRTLYFVRKRDPTVRRPEVREVVQACGECSSIDPAPVRWKRRRLSVDDGWRRLAMDVTHFGNALYLTMVDIGPSRFSIWRRLRSQNSDAVCEQLEAVFLERGAPAEILVDNSTVFRGKRFEELLQKWDITAHFRCAYEPGGNGIVERNHRTIKTMAARTRCSVADAVYWYNMTPQDSRDEATCPAVQLY